MNQLHTDIILTEVIKHFESECLRAEQLEKDRDKYFAQATTFFSMNAESREEIESLKQQLKDLKRERDEFARDFYKWAKKILEELPGNKSLNSFQLLERYKQILKK